MLVESPLVQLEKLFLILSLLVYVELEFLRLAPPFSGERRVNLCVILEQDTKTCPIASPAGRRGISALGNERLFIGKVLDSETNRDLVI